MRHSLKFLSCLLILASCNGEKEVTISEGQQINNQIIDDPIFKRLMSIQQSHLEAVVNNKFNFSKTDQQLIKAGISKCKSDEELIELYKKAGMAYSVPHSLYHCLAKRNG